MDKFDALFNFNIKILNALSMCVSVPRYFQYSSTVLSKNKNMIKYKSSDTLYVLGLGPSLRNVDLSILQDGDIICANRFYKFSNSDKCCPRFYCLMDNEYFVGNAVNDFLKAYQQFPETQFLLNGKYKKEIEKLIESKNNIFYVYGWSGMLKKRSKIDFCRNLPVALNVVCRMIEAGIYMGYKKIILLGCDFNSFAMQQEKHCYDDKDDGVKWKLSYELFCYSFAAKEHEILDHIAKNKNITIFNATEGSLIDAYRRVSI